MIEEVDNQIGVLLNKLEASGQADNTLVIFTSDHGEMLGTNRCGVSSILGATASSQCLRLLSPYTFNAHFILPSNSLLS